MRSRAVDLRRLGRHHVAGDLAHQRQHPPIIVHGVLDHFGRVVVLGRLRKIALAHANERLEFQPAQVKLNVGIVRKKVRHNYTRFLMASIIIGITRFRSPTMP